MYILTNIIYRSFRVYNIQNGVQRDIGRMIAGNLNLTSPPIFHDGTTKVIHTYCVLPPRSKFLQSQFVYQYRSQLAYLTDPT